MSALEWAAVAVWVLAGPLIVFLFDLGMEGRGERMEANRWIKSSRSGPWTDNCVEVRVIAGAGESNTDVIVVRNSKDRGFSQLVFTEAEWDAFVAGVKLGEFDR